MVPKCTRAFSPRTDLPDAFRVFDRDGHGFVTTVELRHVVTTLGERMTDEEADELVREADANDEGHVDYEELIKTTSTPLPPDQYVMPPRKRPPPSTELQQPGPDSVTPNASGEPAERASVSVISEPQPAGGEMAAAVAEGGSVRSGETSAPSSETRGDEKSGSKKYSGNGSTSGSGKGSALASGKGSPSASGKGSKSGSAAGPMEGSKKWSRKASGTGDSPATVSTTCGPPVQAVMQDAPAEKKDGEVANK
ncbi:hypothetical protein HPB49_017485 [Dermacentor silvarum]|uniref:Uncharacterized protein n=2 Tax=Dermacentor silvarum TaxID=543639 RepID=A0ACB8DQA3_DERSI|nr:hypothetical protein HPB49_017485 [Dermacentor silvarum]